MVNVAPACTLTMSLNKYVLSDVNVKSVVMSPETISRDFSYGTNSAQPTVQSVEPKAPTKFAAGSKKPSLGGVSAPVKTGDPGLGRKLGYSKLNGFLNSTSAVVTKDRLLFEVKNPFGSNVPFDTVESIMFPDVPATILFLTYITPLCASSVVFFPSINIPVGQPVNNVLLTLFCDDLLKCIPL